MIVGCMREVKEYEYRVGLTPTNAKEYIKHGHTVIVQSGAGDNAGFSDQEYAAVGSQICNNPKDIYAAADMIVKVKEPLPPEYDMLREGQILFTYLHIAANPELTKVLLDKKIAGVAYETISKDGFLPCLFPMSEIAGRLSVQEGAKYLERHFGGRGILLGGTTGAERGRVAVLGAGSVGFNAAKIAVGMGAEVTIIDIDIMKLKYVDDVFAGRASTLASTSENIDRVIREADLIIGAVLIPGARAPRIITKEHVSCMKKGAVLVDVAVDQGGCTEITRPTTHAEPIFVENGVVCYCVSNMPSAVSLTSTRALTNATLNYGLAIADLGIAEASKKTEAIRLGLNTYRGKCTCAGVATAHDLPYTPAEELLQ